MGLHLYLANLLSGFQTAYQFPFMSQHRMEQLHGKEIDYSFNTLEPDWDIIAQISHELKANKLNVEFKHIKGHQENHIKYVDLPFPAHMNVDVDILAVTFRAEYQYSTRKAIQFPVNVAQPHIANTTITNKYFSKMKTKATE
eukprot:4421574-Ditylum_brightwellii.AAC.1